MRAKDKREAIDHHDPGQPFKDLASGLCRRQAEGEHEISQDVPFILRKSRIRFCADVRWGIGILNKIVRQAQKEIGKIVA